MTTADLTDALEHSVAVIGMAGRFPGAATVEGFWENLRAGVESIRTFSKEELTAGGVPESEQNAPGYVPAKAVLDDIAGFDADFFGVTAREAALLDPQQRLFLEICVELFERAGVVPGPDNDRIGVFGGVSKNTYLFFNLLSHMELRQSPAALQTLVSNDKDYLATRVSYKLGLRGPSLTVQTACSSSLVAVHLACQSVLAGECELAVAGGAAVDVPHHSGYVYEPSGIFSPDGHCRAFDANARGTVFGQGAGAVLLRRLPDALAAGDTVHAVIRGSAVNNDGAAKVGFTAPSIEGQSEVIAEAMTLAGVDAETISYVEAHGTGTALGDPIEVEALTRAFRLWTTRRGFCRLGSVKTNVGHLNAAAGITGLIKTVLALEHAEIPPSLHFERANPKISFPETPFLVNDALREWHGEEGNPLRAGVSSFGIGGTNAHVVLEAYPVVASGPAPSWQLVPVSARSAPALAQVAEQLGHALAARSDIDLSDVAYTQQLRRKPYRYRRAVVARDAAAATVALASGGGPSASQRPAPETPRVAFLFPGQGSQYPDMARGLYGEEPIFQEEVDGCCTQLRALGAVDPRNVLFADDPGGQDAAELLRQTEIAQPALFVVEYALARLWLSWGVKADAVVGHSLGEIVAACIAGVFGRDDALQLVVRRAGAIGSLPAGVMVAVAGAADDVRPHLAPEVEIAALNAPSLTVISGAEPAVRLTVDELNASGMATRKLATSHAFHSAVMEPAVAAVTETAAQLKLRPPDLPCLSNATGTWLREDDAVDPAYWGRQLRLPVRFSDCVGELLEPEHRVLLEVGPGRTLGQLARRHQRWSPGHEVVRSLPDRASSGIDDMVTVLEALGRLWVTGSEPNWEALHRGSRRRNVILPTYPFQRARHWIDPVPERMDATVPTPPERMDATVPTPPTTPSPSGDDEVGSRGESRAPAAGSALERRVVGIFETLLGAEGIDPADDFFDLGGHSLLGVELVSRVRDSLGVELPLSAIFDSPRPSDIALLAERSLRQGVEHALSHRATTAGRDIWFDGVVPAGSAKREAAPPETVLLTGATGFLGTFLLRELLDQTSAEVWCVVRCTDPDAGSARVLSGLRKYDLLEGADVTRLHVVAGDLSRPQLGLSDADLRAVASDVDVIYHNGAKVSFLEPYRLLRPTNVEGTREVLRLACAVRSKSVHHVSSIAVFDCDALNGLTVAEEDDDLAEASGFHGGYDESKWVAERIIGVARERGLSVSVYRPGNIAGHSRTGAVSDGHLVTAMLKGCIAMGTAPDSDAFVDIVPVDYVSRALVHLSLLATSGKGRNFHLVNPTPVRWNEIAEHVRAAGYSLRTVPFGDWRDALRSDENGGNALRVFLPMLEERPLFSGRLYRGHRTAQELTMAGIECSAMDATQISTYLRRLVATGELPPPPVGTLAGAGVA